MTAAPDPSRKNSQKQRHPRQKHWSQQASHGLEMDAELLSGDCQDRTPYERPGEVREHEPSEIHSGDAGRDRDEDAEPGNELGEEDRAPAVSLEARVCFFYVFCPN